MPDRSAWVSFALVAAAAALLVRFPHLVREDANWPQRIALAVLLTGATASLFMGMGWEPGHRFLRRITQRIVCWPVCAVGIAACWWLA